jgi:hypothetical protein
VTPLIDRSKSGGWSPSTRVAVAFLADVPEEVLHRKRREAVMKRLISRLPKKARKDTTAPRFWESVLCLMTQLMRSPTFYEVGHSCGERRLAEYKTDIITGYEFW